MFFREANPPFYRKVCLNGRPLGDTEPNIQKRTDVEAEKTCIDALTLQLRHQTSEIYISLAGTDFALSVRRNLFAASWCEGGLSAAQQPDLPFGNCWRSGLAANVHIIDRGEDVPVEVLVTDEAGTLHSLVELFREGRPAGYYPLPNIESDQDDRMISMVHCGDRMELRRKFGTTLTFKATMPAVEIACAGEAGARAIHRYYRLDRAQHHRGGYIQFHFDASNSGLIPDEMSFAKKRIHILRNTQGVIERVIDPRGVPHDFSFRPSKISGGAPLLIEHGRPSTGAAGGGTYEYVEVEGKDGWRHAAISLIADKLKNTYRFRHRPGETGSAPLRLSEIDLPDKTTSRFCPYASPSGTAPNARATFVTDAVGHGILYEFSKRQTTTLEQLPWRRATGPNRELGVILAGWLRMDVTYFRGSRHRFDERSGKVRPGILTRRLLHEAYEFDAGAGLALARALDGEGMVTSFAYADRLQRPPLEGVLPDGFIDPFAERCRDATEIVNPLGGVRRIVYHPTNRVYVRRVDELGHVTVWDVDDATGMDYAMTRYAREEDERNRKPFEVTEWQFENRDFPACVTRKIVRKTGSSTESPSWEVDLVRVYEADENGNIVQEIADPEGERMIWIYRYDENNNKLSTQYPDKFFAQFRYDAFNRLDRHYRSYRGVKKNWFNARSDRIRELDSNGDLAAIEYDTLARVVRRLEEKGRGAERKKTETYFHYNAVNGKTREWTTGSPKKTYILDGLQRVIRVREPMKKPGCYSYSANGCSNLFRKSKFCPASFYSADVFRRKYYSYDGLQNKTSESMGPFRWYLRFVPPKVLFTYDLAGNLVERREGKAVTTYEYDPLHRLVMTRQGSGFWKRTLRTSTGLEYGSVDSNGVREEKRFDSGGYEVAS